MYTCAWLPQAIKQNEHASRVALPVDYAVAFDITPTGAEVAEWSNIVHFTATDHDCCNYGDRIPGAWRGSAGKGARAGF